MVINTAAKIMHHPLTNRGGQVLFEIRANCTDDGNDDDGDRGEVKNRILVVAKGSNYGGG